MAVSTGPKGTISLHGVGSVSQEVEPGSTSVLLLKIGDSLLQDIKKASEGKESLHFVSGNAPKLRIGGRTIDLSISSDAFRNELYASTIGGSLADLTFNGVISQRCLVKGSKGAREGSTAGSDAALAALKDSLTFFDQEKAAKQSNIVNSVLPAPKNRFDAARKQKRSLLGSSQPVSPALSASGTPRPGLAPTSSFTIEAETRAQALRTPIIHLLALKPTALSTIQEKTHVSKEDLESILQKTAKHLDGKWQLTDRAYRDLDAWNFGYTSQEDRQTAIDNAIRAYDRLRIGKEEQIWQKLLPKQDRGKGIILSRLQLGSQGNRASTPNHAASPLLHADIDVDGEGKSITAANTPRHGASTPRPSSSKNDVMKRLLAKDPKKARAVEEAKVKKRKEREAAREAAASDREGAKPAKRQTAAKQSAKVKSAEIVHSSEDESGEEGEVKDEIKRIDSKISPEKRKADTSSQQNLKSSTSPDSGGETKRGDKKPTAKPKELVDPAKSIASLASKTAASGKLTPRTPNGLAAPPNSQHSTQRSPQKPVSRPSVPSPLGAARPRVASDVSDRTAIGIQRTRPGAGTPLAGNQANSVRKRHDTVTSNGSTTSSGADKKQPDDKKQPATANGSGTMKATVSNGTTHKSEHGVKRKAESSSSQHHDSQPSSKHRKTESTASKPHNSAPTSSAISQPHGTARTSPDASFESSGSDSVSSVLDTITYTQGVNLAEKFRDVYYPAYAQLYDAQAAKEKRGETISKDERERLLAMHRRLEQMKREIQTASQRDSRDD